MIHMNGCCGTCKYGHYDKMQGYVCVNDESEYIADFVEYEHWIRAPYDGMAPPRG